MKFEKTILLVVNPCAGQRKAQRRLADIIAVFNRSNYRVMTYLTATQGDGERIIPAYANDVDMIVCCGGDGTFNEVISGVLKCGVDIPVGYVPTGSTNDFAASLHLSSDAKQAAQDIIEGHEICLDAGSFCGRPFSYIASFGAFTRTSYTTPQNVKNLLGHAAYVLSGIQELSQLKPYHLRFTLPDGEIVEDQFLFGAITNSTSVGGILTLSEKHVDLSDGQFELILIRAPKDPLELADCVRTIQKQTYDCSMLTFRKAAQIRVTAPKDMDWTLDGEREAGREQIQIDCLHQAVRFVQKKLV